MSEIYSNEPMLEMYIFETTQQLEQLETGAIDCEKQGLYSEQAINEMFRYMHTIKGSSAMMLFNNISTLAHAMEDLLYFLREKKPEKVDASALSDLILEGVDFMKIEVEKIKSSSSADGDPKENLDKLNAFLIGLKEANELVDDKTKAPTKSKQKYYIAPDKKEVFEGEHCYKATVFFSDDCGMENIRAYTIIHNLSEVSKEIYHIPEDILEDLDSTEEIQKNGFEIFIRTDKSYDEVNKYLEQTLFLKSLKFDEITDNEFKEITTKYSSKDTSAIQEEIVIPEVLQKTETINSMQSANNNVQSVISVNVEKLDKLMDLVGEMVIAEAMVTQSPEVEQLGTENFLKAARQLHKISGDIQDMVMSIRMVPLSTTFSKMNRIMRDMCKKLGKQVELKVIGEETEVDKNIIEHISDPLMHIIRNSVDHGIESNDERELANKSRVGTVILEAKNSGSDVLVIIQDDGRGLDRDKILNKAIKNGVLPKNENEMSDREVFNLILLPGFSTKEKVTEYSGRGVGMDVVLKNLEMVGGSVSVDSVLHKGTTITLKIPLTLAIIDGMNIRVGESRYTIPLVTIKESFRPNSRDYFMDPEGNEMIMVRGQCYPIVRIHKKYNVKTDVTDLDKGILIMVEDEKTICLFADELIGQQQVVVKSLPAYIKSLKKIKGLAGCTLLGDGSISLILDIGDFCRMRSS